MAAANSDQQKQMMMQFRNSQDHFTPGGKPGQSQTQLNMNKRGVGTNIRQMANNV